MSKSTLCLAHHPAHHVLTLVLLVLLVVNSTNAWTIQDETVACGSVSTEEAAVARILPDRRTVPAGLNVNVSVVAERLLTAVRGVGLAGGMDGWMVNVTSIAQEFLNQYPSITGVLVHHPTVNVATPALVIHIRDLLVHHPHLRSLPRNSPVTTIFHSLITEARLSPSTSSSLHHWTYPLRDCRLSFDATTWWFTYLYARSTNDTIVGLMMTTVLKRCGYGDKGSMEKDCYVERMICVPSWRGHGDVDKGRRGHKSGGNVETVVVARCHCRPDSYFPSADFSWRGFPIADIENNATDRCSPCPSHCDTCAAPGVCMARRDAYLQMTVICIQGGCMLITVVLALVVFKQRKCKTIASGMWRILETILLGIFLLYSTVLFGLFPPSISQCLIEPWLREVGFVVCYGAVILKLYRHLIEFRTRKAHRWVVKDTDLLKYLMIMTLSVLVYMAAFTAMALHFIQERYSILSGMVTVDGMHYWTCKATWWDYVTEMGEATILVFGIQFSYGSRNARTQFDERRFLCCSVILELIISGIYYTSRALILPGLHPNVILVVQTLRIQLTVTPLLLLVFVPKLWYQQKQARSLGQEYSCRLPVDAFKDVNAHGPLTGNNSDVEMAEVTLADMSPDDIRTELKRLYMQLEIFKNKTICRDNPHISKRRGGRKAQHRRFSLQNLYGKHHREKKPPPPEEAIEAEQPSRTPEDSVCSAEGPSAVYSDLPSVAPPPQHTSM